MKMLCPALRHVGTVEAVWIATALRVAELERTKMGAAK
jgi:hypothetical protein